VPSTIRLAPTHPVVPAARRKQYIRKGLWFNQCVKIAIDVRRVSDFGVGTYIRNVVRTLGRLDRDNQYFLIGSPEQIGEIGSLPENIQTIPLTHGEVSLGGWLEFRKAVRRLRCDLVHIPHLFWLPRGLPCPYVMTVHDVLEHLALAHGKSGMKRYWHFQFTRRALEGAARIVAVSQFTRQEVSHLFRIPLSKIDVAYNALDERFLHGHATDAEKLLIAERYQVNYPFLLYVGRVSAHKNVVRIIEAFSALKAELAKDAKFPDLKLIIIGDDVSSHPDLRRTVRRSGVDKDVRFLGFVPIDILRIFYDAAKVFVFPSLYEGFGLPPLEAMAHGTPVVASNTSSLPEVVGDAAVLVNPENVFEIMRGLHSALLDPVLRSQMKQRSVEQVAKFSWEASVRQLLKTYRAALGRAQREHTSRVARAS
jgi:glycosyltransferase involved in cell wall biosynthesis